MLESSKEADRMSKKVTRSPNYPGISLGEAIERARIVYREMHTHAADRDSLAKILGYGSLNGASVTVISALQKFGLLEAAGVEYRISKLALEVLLYPKGTPERGEAIRQMAFRPSTFEDLHERYGTSLPNDELVRAYLIKAGFNPKSVGTVIRSYRDTIDFVIGESDQSELDSHDSSELATSPAGSILDDSSAQKEKVATSTTTHGRETPTRADSLDNQLSRSESTLTFRISRDSVVHVTFDGRVTQEAIDKLIFFLEGSKDTFPSKKEVERVRQAVWHGRDYDQVVRVTGLLGESGGKRYFAIEGSDSGVPEDELDFESETFAT
jgi:hypothetical protein